MPHADMHGWLSSPSLRILATHILLGCIWCAKPAGVSTSIRPPGRRPHATQRIAAAQNARLSRSCTARSAAHLPPPYHVMRAIDRAFAFLFIFIPTISFLSS